MKLNLNKLFFYFKDRFNKVIFIIYKFFLKKSYPIVANRIISEAQKYKKIILVYDFSCSSNNYGDYFYFLMIGRYFKSLDKNLRIYLIEDNPKFKKKYKLEIIEISKTIIKNLEKIELISYEGFTNLKNLDKDNFILYKSKIIKRKPIYIHAYNLVNYLSKYLNYSQKNNFLLNEDEFSEFRFKKITNNLGKFIAIGCRYNPKERTYSNFKDNDFKNIISYLLENFPSHNIVVLSDLIGCNHFSKVFSKPNDRILYSAFISSGFLESTVISIKAEILLQFYGGGISIPRIYSLKPYIMFSPACFEIPVSENKFSFWSTKFQIYYTGKSKIKIDKFKKEISNLKSSLKIN